MNFPYGTGIRLVTQSELHSYSLPTLCIRFIIVPFDLPNHAMEEAHKCELY